MTDPEITLKAFAHSALLKLQEGKAMLEVAEHAIRAQKQERVQVTVPTESLIKLIIAYSNARLALLEKGGSETDSVSD